MSDRSQCDHYNVLAVGLRRGSGERRPCVHKLPPLIEYGAAGICGLDLVAARVGKRGLGNVVLKSGAVACPVLEGRRKPWTVTWP